MKKIYSLILVFAFVFSTNVPAFAWGEEGHRAVGAGAAAYLKPATLNRITQILLGDSIAGVSVWADTTKRRADEDDLDPETKSFLANDKNDKNDTWHYVDLPLDCPDYNSCEGFKRPDDIVQMINFSVRRLKTGKEDPQHPISERNALRMLIHLIGDLHMPFHVGAGFINENDLSNILIETDPQRIRQFKFLDDQGGNKVVLKYKPILGKPEDPEREANLHFYWDVEIVQRLMFAAKRTRSPETFGRFLKESITPENSWNAQGNDVYQWASQWAADSLKQSKQSAYKNLRITEKREREINGRKVTDYLISRGNAAAYDTQAQETARTQIAKAGYRLAKMLEAIYAK
ncbi:MAG TPA: S1/P1 nuclease [Pyrinomonadaceae bacterium]|jgi:hypothetical protein